MKSIGSVLICDLRSMCKMLFSFYICWMRLMLSRLCFGMILSAHRLPRCMIKLTGPYLPSPILTPGSAYRNSLRFFSYKFTCTFVSSSYLVFWFDSFIFGCWTILRFPNIWRKGESTSTFLVEDESTAAPKLSFLVCLDSCLVHFMFICSILLFLGAAVRFWFFYCEVSHSLLFISIAYAWNSFYLIFYWLPIRKSGDYF